MQAAGQVLHSLCFTDKDRATEHKRPNRKKNLEKLAQLEMSNAEDGVTLGTVNVKDAFLMVDQPTPLRVQLPFGNLIVLKNLPGQRLGAKCWCWHFRVFWL